MTRPTRDVPALYDAEAELYDIAFGWDVDDEVEWLLDRLGPGCASVLEPGCGTGRMLEAFGPRGLDVVGVEVSPAMARFARARLRSAGVSAEIVLADMTAFALGRRLAAAVCPINTLAHSSRPGSLAISSAWRATSCPGRAISSSSRCTIRPRRWRSANRRGRPAAATFGYA